MRTNPVRAKLRSQKGASIIFALFFFIVCAVIGSIVLTAATAAAGRAKGVREANNRYYAVNSAADVLEHELEKSGAWVRKTTTQTETTTAVSTLTTANGVTTENASPPTPSSGNPVTEYTQGDAEYTQGDAQITPLLRKVAEAESSVGEPFAGLRDLTINHSTDILDSKVTFVKDAVTSYTGVGGTPENNACNMKIQVTDSTGQYYLVLVCPAHIDERREEKVTSSTIKVTNDTTPGAPAGQKNKTETTVKEVTIVRTITWSVSSVVKASSTIVPSEGGEP